MLENPWTLFAQEQNWWLEILSCKKLPSSLNTVQSLIPTMQKLMHCPLLLVQKLGNHHVFQGGFELVLKVPLGCQPRPVFLWNLIIEEKKKKAKQTNPPPKTSTGFKFSSYSSAWRHQWVLVWNLNKYCQDVACHCSPFITCWKWKQLRFARGIPENIGMVATVCLGGRNSVEDKHPGLGSVGFTLAPEGAFLILSQVLCCN